MQSEEEGEVAPTRREREREEGAAVATARPAMAVQARGLRREGGC